MNINRNTILSKLKERKIQLKPNQQKISLPIISRMCKKMQRDLKFRPIYVSKENKIIDGHHRYISSIISNFKLEVITDYPSPSEPNSFEWDLVDFVVDDWDSPSKVKMLNELDARYNNMKIEDVESIIN